MVKLETSGQCSLILSTNNVKRFIIRVKCESVPPSSIKIDIKPYSDVGQRGGKRGGALMVDEKDIDTYIKFLNANTGDVDVDNHCAEITRDIIAEIEQTLPYYETRSVTKLYADIIALKNHLTNRLSGSVSVPLDGNMTDLITEYFYRVQDEEEDEEAAARGGEKEAEKALKLQALEAGGKTRKRRNSVKKRKHKKKKQSSKKKQKGKKPRTRKNN